MFVLTVLSFAIIIILLLIASQDFSERLIDVRLLLILCILCIGITLQKQGIQLIVLNTLINALFISIQFGVLAMYIALKKQQVVNIFNKYIGSGDLILFLAICPIACSENFLLLHCILLLFSSFFSIIYLQFSQDKNIPLAGIYSMFLVPLILFNFTKNNDFFYQPFSLLYEYF